MEKIFDKIKKLLAYQEDAERRDAIHEAANAAQRIQDLLLKHNLDLATVKGKVERDSSDIKEDSISLNDLGWDKRHGSWMESLFSVIAEYNLCRAILSTGLYFGGKTIINMYLIGTKENIEIITYIVEQLIEKARNAEKAEWSRYHGSDKRGRFRRGFLMGFVIGIKVQLKKQKETIISQNNNMMALIKVNDTAISQYVSNRFKSLKSGKARKSNHSDGVLLGYQNGLNTTMNKGIESNLINQKLIS